MKKRFPLLLFVVLIIIALGFFFYKTKLQYSCSYPEWVKKNNNVVNQLLSEFREGQEKGCRIPVTTCIRNACSDPMMWLECNKVTSVCGEKISCECK